MKLQALHVHNFRGIRDLRIEPDGQNFVVDGPNGAGKSGVVDGIEFALTGRIARLEGTGTGGLSVRTHGPHVDQRDNPREAFVRATIDFGNNKTGTIERSLDKPREPTITPPEMAPEFEWLSQHPELALSRRELTKLILVEPGSRAKSIQTLLKLEALEETRANLTRAANALSREAKTAQHSTTEARRDLLSAAGLAELNTDGLLKAVNVQRRLLGAADLSELKADTSVVTGVSGTASGSGGLTKATALSHLSDLASSDLRGAASGLIAVLEEAGDLRKVGQVIRQRELLRSGLELVADSACPLCDTAWDQAKLKEHIAEKLRVADLAERVSRRLANEGAVMASSIQAYCSRLERCSLDAATLGLEDARLSLAARRDELLALGGGLTTPHGILAARDRLASLSVVAEAIEVAAKRLRTAVEGLPDATEVEKARVYLVRCDERLARYRQCRSMSERLERRTEVAANVRDLFNKTVDDHLTTLYKAIEEDFVSFYRFINSDDEVSFRARLQPDEGKLTLDVNFYGRGLFPPGAYHSEGHQDGMGLCLYLALMKRLLGDKFSFAVLDDVLMSVDKGHRKQVCRLLRQTFPNTQFVITTHDEVWLHQMVSEQLVRKNAVKHFRGWTVDQGPLVLDYADVWEAIDQYVEREEISQAAALLRRHLEHVAGDLCERLTAAVTFRRDADHDLGELLPAATGKWGKLLGAAKAVANSWNNKDEEKAVAEGEAMFKERLARTTVEQWAVNKGVHYNEWATFAKEDFRPVVAAYKELIECFRCPSCRSWLSPSPARGTPEAIMCDCKKLLMNLKKKARDAS